MKTALAYRRTPSNAQQNTPNRDFGEVKFRKAYVEVETGAFDPDAADEVTWARMWEWRMDMNRLIL